MLKASVINLGSELTLKYYFPSVHGYAKTQLNSFLTNLKVDAEQKCKEIANL